MCRAKAVPRSAGPQLLRQRAGCCADGCAQRGGSVCAADEGAIVSRAGAIRMWRRAR